MASDRGYLEFILEQLADLDGVRARAMMGEYNYRDRVIGGIYDDRLLVKATPGAATYMPSATEELPYPGAKPMLLVDNVDDRAYLCGLFDAMVDDLPAPRIRKK
jgi:TfoX/Sxy family transcriptional regulator of competence genes